MDRDKFTELAALHAINALDGEERQVFEQYLRSASLDEQRELQELQDVWATLPLALPDTAAPTHLKARLLDRLHEEVAPQSARVVEFAPRPTRRHWWEFFAWEPASALLAVATLLLAITSGLLLWHNSRVARERDQLTQEVAKLAQQNIATQKQLDTLVTQTTRLISLAGQEEAKQASAKIFWDTKRNEWVLYVFNLPPVPADKSYQLWYITNEKVPINANILFRPNAQGRGEVQISLPPNTVPKLAATAISLEENKVVSEPSKHIYLVGTIGA